MPGNEIEEIKNRLSITEVVQEYVPLRKAGVNLKALCPFHQEKTPSFMVTPVRQRWHCFGCSEGGDIFSFVQKMEGIEFPEALRLLAKKANVPLPEYRPELASQRNLLLEICVAATEFFQVQLQADGGRVAREYIAKRKLNEETVRAWQIGFAPNEWDALLGFLQQKGFKGQDIFLAGVAVQKQSGNATGPVGAPRYYDRFRGRLMFPLRDAHGQVVGFTARQLEGLGINYGEQGKYVNTPQTAIYDKGKLLFGYDTARDSIKRALQAVVVEGQMDVIASHQAGVTNVVASSGTALTLDQIKLLKRVTECVALCFDMDAAGQSAAWRGIQVALKEEMEVKVIRLPPEAGKDADECIKKDVSLWHVAIDKAVPVMEYYFASATAGKNLDQVQDRKILAKQLLPLVAQLTNPVEQTHWLKRLAVLVRTDEGLLRTALRKNPPPQSSPTLSRGEGDKGGGTPLEILFARLIGFALHNPAREVRLAEIPWDLVPEDLAQGLVSKCKLYYTSGDMQGQTSPLKNWQGIEPLEGWWQGISRIFGEIGATEIEMEFLRTLLLFKRAVLKQALKAVEHELALAELSNASDRLQELTIRFQDLSKTLRGLEGVS